MKLKHLAACITAATLLTACGGDSSSDSETSIINLPNVQKVLNTNADIALAIYSDAVDTALSLKTALATFRANPTEANLEAAKKAWLVAREPYGQSEVYRFRNSPIDSTDYSSENGPEGDINAWPLGEALIDYVKTNDTDFGTDQIGVTANSAGIKGNGAIDAAHAAANQADNIIGNTNVTINADLLANTATADDEHDVIAGYHAIEFMLWGQDLNEDNNTTDGTDRGTAVKSYVFNHGGQRPLSDFVPGFDGTTTDYNANTLSHRRHQFMAVAVDKLIADLEAVRDGWKAGATYRTAFTTVTSEAQAKQKLAEILTGMGTLSEGELAGERMQIAFSANSQEDEHSCFSDNTHRDVWLNAEGVANSYYGAYAGYDSTLDGTDNVTTRAITNGYGIDDYLRDAGKAELATRVETALTTTTTHYTAIDASARNGQPFDVLIMAANQTANNPVYKTITALNTQSALIAEIATTLGISGSIVDPDASACDTKDPLASCDE